MPSFAEIWQKHRLPIALGGISVLSIITSIILLVKSAQNSSPIQFSSSRDITDDSSQSSESANTKKMIHVDVEGGVRAPGLYVLPSASRIDDAIAKAGGLSEEVDMKIFAKNINRASVLVDGAKIYIPEKADNTSYNIKTTEDTKVTSYNNLINVNTASENELDSLPGVGTVTAKKIIDNRPYQTLEELVSKKALGNALFEKIKGNLSL